MTKLPLNKFLPLAAILLLSGCFSAAEGPVTVGIPADARDAAAPVVVEKTETTVVTVVEKPAAATGAVQPIALGSLGVRTAPPRLDQISLLREDDRTAPRDVWAGANADETQLLYALRGKPQQAVVKNILKLIALSAVYEPAGFSPEQYLAWRVDTLAALDMYGAAARLQNAALLGRSHNEEGARRLVTYLLADKKSDAACLEVKTVGFGGDFWGQAYEFCNNYVNGKVDTAAMAAIINKSGLLPVPAPIADNTQLVADIEASLDNDGEAGSLLIKALAALEAEHKAAKTKELAGKALRKAGFEAEAKAL